MGCHSTTLIISSYCKQARISLQASGWPS